MHREGIDKIKAGTKIVSISKSEKLFFRCGIEEEYVNRLNLSKKVKLKVNEFEVLSLSFFYLVLRLLLLLQL